MTTRRDDLLALTEDDLAVLTNRGTLKRALRELEAGDITGELSVGDAGAITVVWSDGPTVTIAGEAVVADARCTCPASNLCRHVVRSVLIYERAAAAAAQADGAEEAAGGGPWNPGAIVDEALVDALGKAAVGRARRRLEAGMLVELVRSAKPIARFHGLGHTIRFLVPGDPRYVHCDCADRPPCAHAALAVWAFRALAADEASGLVTTGAPPAAAPASIIADIDGAASLLMEVGAAGASDDLLGRIGRLEGRCREAELTWPADTVAELATELRRYGERDARFAPEHLVAVTGELLLRADTIASGTDAIPQALVRGGRDRTSAIGAARLVGLGCGVAQDARRLRFTVPLQDLAGGGLGVLVRDVAAVEEPTTTGPIAAPAGPPEPPRPLHELGRRLRVREVALAEWGRGQLLCKGAKRAASGQLALGRGRIGASPQAFAWEQLRPPVLLDGFGELRARLATLPPPSLRPRRATEDFHVIPVAGVDEVRFDAPSQMAVATVRDQDGARGEVRHPFTARGRAGVAATLATLERSGDAVRFIAGPWRLGPEGPVTSPTAIVLGEPGERVMLQPWIDREPAAPGTDAEGEDAAASVEVPDALEESAEARSHVAEAIRAIEDALGELLVEGVARADARTGAALGDLARRTESVGFDRLARRVGEVASAIEARMGSAKREIGPSVEAGLTLVALTRLARDLSC